MGCNKNIITQTNTILCAKVCSIDNTLFDAEHEYVDGVLVANYYEGATYQWKLFGNNQLALNFGVGSYDEIVDGMGTYGNFNVGVGFSNVFSTLFDNGLFILNNDFNLELSVTLSNKTTSKTIYYFNG